MKSDDNLKSNIYTLTNEYNYDAIKYIITYIRKRDETNCYRRELIFNFWNLIKNIEQCKSIIDGIKVFKQSIKRFDYKNVLIYDQNKLAEENNAIKEYQFIYQNMINYNEAHPDAPLMPYIIFDTSKTGTDILPWSKAVSIPVSVTFVNTGLERAYASVELEQLAINDGLCTATSSAAQKAEAVKTYYKHHCPSWTGDNIEMVVQGTSSEFYPRRNYKIKTKTEYDSDEKERIHIFLNKGPYEQEYIAD